MKYEYTEKNHFKFGYSLNHPYGRRQNPQEQFVFSYGRIQKEISHWREANREAAKLIRLKFKDPLCLLFSGGTDSEACALSFMEARVPLHFACLRMKNGFNAHDILYAEKFSEKYKVKIHYFDFDVEEFFRNGELFHYTDPIRCVSPILACHLWLAEQVAKGEASKGQRAVPIMAQGECQLKKVVPQDYVPGESAYLPGPWKLVESERLCSLYMHFINKETPAVPGFFQFTPEQIYSFLKFNPLLQDLVNNRVHGKLGTRTSKNKMVQQFYPEIEERPKYTGFEKIQTFHDEYRKLLAQRYPHSDSNFEIEYNELLSSLSPRAETSPRPGVGQEPHRHESTRPNYLEKFRAMISPK